jgi:hypothetical protein
VGPARARCREHPHDPVRTSDDPAVHVFAVDGAGLVVLLTGVLVVRSRRHAARR